jgi:peptidyl-prolyl cis-trans isomerase D
LAAQNTTLDEARDDLAAELAADSARRAIDDMVEGFDDRLASGATLEDLVNETDMTLGQIDFTATSSEAMAAYPAFRQAAADAVDGDFPAIIQLDDGGIFALRLDAIIPPTPIPFADARTAVTDSWTAQAVTKSLSDLATSIKSQIEGGAALGAFGITEILTDITRSSTIADTPASLLQTVFETDAGQVRVLEEGTFVAVMQLDTITPGATDGPDAEALKAAIAAQAEQALAQDAFALYTNALTSAAGITLDNAAINSVHAQFP